jgi:hypothetical protein
MYHSEFSFSRVDDVPDEAHWYALQRLEEQRIQRLKEAEAFQKSRVEHRRVYRDEFHALVGEQHLDRYLRLHARRKRNLHSLSKSVPKTSDGLRQLAEHRLQTLKGTEELVARSGVDVGKIRQLQKAFNEQSAADLRQRIGTLDTGPRPRPEELGGDEWISLTPYIWATREQEHGSTKGPEARSWDIACDVNTGRMKHESRITVRDAGDDEDVWVYSLTEIGTVVRVRRDCEAVRVFAVFENLASHAQGAGSDECGYSTYWVDNGICAVVRVERFYPKGSSVEKRAWIKDEDGERGTFVSSSRDEHNGFIHAWDFDFWDPGETIFSPILHLPGPYEQDSWLSVWVGLNAWNYVAVNDYTINDYLDYELRLASILVSFQ